jgi:DNA replication factor GINS
MNYKKIFQIWEEQADKKRLIKLNKNFYKDLGEIIKNSDSEIEKLEKTSLQRQLMEKEIDNIINMVKSIYITRFNMILDSVKKNLEIDVTSLAETELNLYNDIRGSIEKYIKNIDLLIRGQSLKTIDKKLLSKYVIVRFLKELPAIAGNDEKTYGPFKKEDVVTLPKKIAETLLERDAVSLILIAPKSELE